MTSRRKALREDADPPPIAPTPPDLEACCGQGCDPCIFDLYAVEHERYLAQWRAWQERQSQRPAQSKRSKSDPGAR
jgi:hypothetical protein